MKIKYSLLYINQKKIIIIIKIDLKYGKIFKFAKKDFLASCIIMCTKTGK